MLPAFLVYLPITFAIIDIIGQLGKEFMYIYYEIKYNTILHLYRTISSIYVSQLLCKRKFLDAHKRIKRFAFSQIFSYIRI